jgi:hypothetical protein
MNLNTYQTKSLLATAAVNDLTIFCYVSSEYLHHTQMVISLCDSHKNENFIPTTVSFWINRRYELQDKQHNTACGAELFLICSRGSGMKLNLYLYQTRQGRVKNNFKFHCL